MESPSRTYKARLEEITSGSSLPEEYICSHGKINLYRLLLFHYTGAEIQLDTISSPTKRWPKLQAIPQRIRSLPIFTAHLAALLPCLLSTYIEKNFSSYTLPGSGALN